MAINRTGKSRNSADAIDDADHANTIEKPLERTKLSKEELERGKQDVASINNDLKLLSTLLGRPISANDLPKIANQFGGKTSAPLDSTVSIKSTTTTTTTTTSTKKPAILREVELLQTLLQRQNEKNEKNSVKDSNLLIAEPEPIDTYGKTNDAILATLLKQQGIGPAHNNIPVEVKPRLKSKVRRFVNVNIYIIFLFIAIDQSRPVPDTYDYNHYTSS